MHAYANICTYVYVQYVHTHTLEMQDFAAINTNTPTRSSHCPKDKR